MRVGLLEVSHWHFPLYAEALQAADVEVVAVSDGNPVLGRQVAERFGARAYDCAARLLQAEPLDLAFVFARHAQMPALAAALVERRTPFVLEKPGGLSAAAVAALRIRAEAVGLFVAVPFVQLVGPVYAALQRLIADEGARFSHSSWRFFGGPPSRYQSAGCDWLLDPALSGGGCLMNLAPHFIDLARRLHGPARGTVARLSAARHRCAVEDYAMVSLACAGGASALVETGYCFPQHPAKREYSFSLVADRHYVRSVEDGLLIYREGRDEVERLGVELDADPLYGRFVARTLSDLRSGAAPLAGLADLEAVMRVMDVAYGRS